MSASLLHSQPILNNNHILMLNHNPAIPTKQLPSTMTPTNRQKLPVITPSKSLKSPVKTLEPTAIKGLLPNNQLIQISTLMHQQGSSKFILISSMVLLRSSSNHRGSRCMLPAPSTTTTASKNKATTLPSMKHAIPSVI